PRPSKRGLPQLASPVALGEVPVKLFLSLDFVVESCPGFSSHGRYQICGGLSVLLLEGFHVPWSRGIPVRLVHAVWLRAKRSPPGRQWCFRCDLLRLPLAMGGIRVKRPSQRKSAVRLGHFDVVLTGLWPGPSGPHHHSSYASARLSPVSSTPRTIGRAPCREGEKDAEAAPRVILEPAAAVVEPAEA